MDGIGGSPMSMLAWSEEVERAQLELVPHRGHDGPERPTYCLAAVEDDIRGVSVPIYTLWRAGRMSASRRGEVVAAGLDNV
jgi:hypothetical protein